MVGFVLKICKNLYTQTRDKSSSLGRRYVIGHVVKICVIVIYLVFSKRKFDFFHRIPAKTAPVLTFNVKNCNCFVRFCFPGVFWCFFTWDFVFRKCADHGPFGSVFFREHNRCLMHPQHATQPFPTFFCINLTCHYVSFFFIVQLPS